MSEKYIVSTEAAAIRAARDASYEKSKAATEKKLADASYKRSVAATQKKLIAAQKKGVVHYKNISELK
tara:strand:+ start:155 stop:358 length:204 start_codon:yes stop_codon:yes gene_type:complete